MVVKGKRQGYYYSPNHIQQAGYWGHRVATRRATRVRAKAATHVGFIGTDAKFTAPLLELSPFGLSVQTSREVTIGTIFRVGIKVGADYFRAAAIVRARFPGGFALEFLSMTAIDREMMRRLYLRLQMAARDE
jgi:hypothetical protein